MTDKPEQSDPDEHVHVCGECFCDACGDCLVCAEGMACYGFGRNDEDALAEGHSGCARQLYPEALDD